MRSFFSIFQLVRRTSSNLFVKPCIINTALRMDKLMTPQTHIIRLGIVSKCQYGTQAPQVLSSNEGSDGVLQKFMKKFGWADNSRSVNMGLPKKLSVKNNLCVQRLRVSSFMMYQSVADKINYKQFFEAYNMPNTFNSWFLVTELHVWILLLRAMAEGSESGEDGRFIRNCIVEAMWADVNTRAKKLGSQNPGGVRDQIQVLSQQFQAALITYDEGIAGDDMVLAGAIWRRFFEMDCENYEQLERLVKYVRCQVFIRIF